MKKTLMSLVTLLALGFATRASLSQATPEKPAAPPTTPNLDDNPYLELYKLRVIQAELSLRRQESLAGLAAAKLRRAQQLIASRAISREEYEVLSSEASVTSTDRGLAMKKVDEAKTFLRIVDALVKRGIAIPLCTYETE